MDKLNFLIIDTAASYLKIALSYEDRTYTHTLKEDFKHIETLLPGIAVCFEELGVNKKELTHIGVCTGPGSFTGIRIGIATALGLSYALSIPCFGFSVFDVYQYLYKNSEDLVIPVIDAKKKRFYCSFLEKENPYEMLDISENDILNKLNHYKNNSKIIFTGKDVPVMDLEIFKDISFIHEYQDDYSAGDLIPFAKWNLQKNLPLKAPKPIYLRKSEAEIMLEKSANVKK